MTKRWTNSKHILHLSYPIHPKLNFKNNKITKFLDVTKKKKKEKRWTNIQNISQSLSKSPI